VFLAVNLFNFSSFSLIVLSEIGILIVFCAFTDFMFAHYLKNLTHPPLFAYPLVFAGGLGSNGKTNVALNLIKFRKKIYSIKSYKDR